MTAHTEYLTFNTRKRHELVIASADSVSRADPKLVTSWAEPRGCGKSGDGCGPGMMGSTIPSLPISRRC